MSNVWLYVNGAAQTSEPQLDPPLADDADEPWRMGHASDNAHQIFGHVDEVAFYPRALTEQQIGNHFNGAGAYQDRVLADDPLLYYRFEEVSGVVVDSSGNGLNGQPNGLLLRGQAGKHGNGVFFGATDETLQQAQVSDIGITHDMRQAWTMEAWWKWGEEGAYPANHVSKLIGKGGIVEWAHAYIGVALTATNFFEFTCSVADEANNNLFAGFGFSIPVPAEMDWLHLAAVWEGSVLPQEGWGILIP